VRPEAKARDANIRGSSLSLIRLLRSRERREPARPDHPVLRRWEGNGNPARPQPRSPFRRLAGGKDGSVGPGPRGGVVDDHDSPPIRWQWPAPEASSIGGRRLSKRLLDRPFRFYQGVVRARRAVVSAPHVCSLYRRTFLSKPQECGGWIVMTWPGIAEEGRPA